MLPRTCSSLTFYFCLTVSKKNKDGQTREQEYSSESHYRIVSPTFQYKMSHKRVGKCIIINNKNFDEKTGTANMLHTHYTYLSFIKYDYLKTAYRLNRDECTQWHGPRRRWAVPVLQEPGLRCLHLQWSDMWEDGASSQRRWEVKSFVTPRSCQNHSHSIFLSQTGQMK